MKKTPIKVGFDFDGVVMYNPVRIFRPIVSLAKRKKVMSREELEFYVPQSNFQRWLWLAVHQSSVFPAPGLSELKQLVDVAEIDAKLITGRNTFLGDDLKRKFRWFKLDRIFNKVFITEQDEQPHLYKERIIKQLDLDYFVEDNWDIVSYLRDRGLKTKIIWVTNVFDKGIEYQYKCKNLRQAIEYITG